MTEKKSIRLAGRTIEHSPHVCAFFNAREEEYQLLIPFIKEGFDQGDRAFHIIDPRNWQDHLQRLERAGIIPRGRISARTMRCDNFNTWIRVMHAGE